MTMREPTEMELRCAERVAQLLERERVPIPYRSVLNERIVRAVLDELRKPTEEMKISGGYDITEDGHGEVLAGMVWQSMIDVASP